jgi:hypothetical protein
VVVVDGEVTGRETPDVLVDRLRKRILQGKTPEPVAVLEGAQ